MALDCVAEMVWLAGLQRKRVQKALNALECEEKSSITVKAVDAAIRDYVMLVENIAELYMELGLLARAQRVSAKIQTQTAGEEKQVETLDERTARIRQTWAELEAEGDDGPSDYAPAVVMQHLKRLRK